MLTISSIIVIILILKLRNDFKKSYAKVALVSETLKLVKGDMVEVSLYTIMAFFCPKTESF